MARPSSPGPTGADMAGIGIYFAGAALLPIIGGVFLDGVFHTSPVFVIIGLVVGLAAGGAAIWLKVREFTR
jgi:ATP synthase protein I